MGDEVVLSSLYSRDGIWSLLLKPDVLIAVRHSWEEQILFYLFETPESPKELRELTNVNLNTISSKRLRYYPVPSIDKIVIRWNVGLNTIDFVTKREEAIARYKIRFRGRTDQYAADLEEMYGGLVEVNKSGLS